MDSQPWRDSDTHTLAHSLSVTAVREEAGAHLGGGSRASRGTELGQGGLPGGGGIRRDFVFCLPWRVLLCVRPNPTSCPPKPTAWRSVSSSSAAMILLVLKVTMPMAPRSWPLPSSGARSPSRPPVPRSEPSLPTPRAEEVRGLPYTMTVPRPGSSGTHTDFPEVWPVTRP